MMQIAEVVTINGQGPRCKMPKKKIVTVGQTHLSTYRAAFKQNQTGFVTSCLRVGRVSNVDGQSGSLAGAAAYKSRYINKCDR